MKKTIVASFLGMLVALFCAAAILSPNVAGAERLTIELDTVIIDVDGDVVSVDVYGNALAFYGSRFAVGDKVHVVIEKGCIIDVVSYSFLEEPFGASSFFIFMKGDGTMYIIYNGDDDIVNVVSSPMAAKLKVAELHRNGDPDAHFEYDEGAREQASA